jgi:hypothetical protein
MVVVSDLVVCIYRVNDDESWRRSDASVTDDVLWSQRREGHLLGAVASSTSQGLC